MNPVFQSSLVVAEPGPYLYVGRIFPDQIYGFYRHIDGQLALLPGFPINVPSVSDPQRGWGAIIWMKKHPRLPVFYTVHTFDGLLRGWEILSDGALLELPHSPLQIAAFNSGIQGLDVAQDGRYFYLNARFETIIRGRLDLESGDFIDFEDFQHTGVVGRAILLSEDNRYLFASAFVSNRIQRYRVLDDSLERLLPDFELDHDITWLWLQADLIVTGAIRQSKASALLIDSRSL